MIDIIFKAIKIIFIIAEFVLRIKQKKHICLISFTSEYIIVYIIKL